MDRLRDQRPRVLVIDDDALVCRSLSLGLTPVADVVTAMGGLTAVEWLERDPQFNLLLCHLAMPFVDGVAVHAHLESNHPHLTERLYFTRGARSVGYEGFRAKHRAKMLPEPIDLAALRALVQRLARSA